MKRKAEGEPAQGGRGAERLYTLEVRLLGGPMSEEFLQQNPVVSRTIQIRGDQTLEDLHQAIFEAFEREEEHMYEFQLGKDMEDPNPRRYVLPTDMEGPLSGPDRPAGLVTNTAIGSLGLKLEQSFGYWFDFGDDWWHQVSVVAIDEKAPPGSFPRVAEQVGQSPPQYPEWDEDEDEDFDEDEDLEEDDELEDDFEEDEEEDFDEEFEEEDEEDEEEDDEEEF